MNANTETQIQIGSHKLKNQNYEIPGAGFAVGTNAVSPEINSGTIRNCRETFYSLWGETTKYMFFNAGTRGKILNLSLFFLEVEKKLGLKPEDRLKFAFAPKGYTLITLTPWWTKNDVRRQIMTILLRCGTAFTGDFHSALISDPYSKGTENAMLAFLEGRTNSTSVAGKIKDGWVNFFSDKDAKFVKECLV